MGLNSKGIARKKYWNKVDIANLVAAVQMHGTKSWRRITDDARFDLQHFTADDLQRQHSRLLSEAKQEQDADLEPKDVSISISNKASARRERRAFSALEDELLLEGFSKHGPRWSKILRDHLEEFKHRRSTDLRDRFRNAFPDQYAKAGFKSRAPKIKDQRRGSLSSSSNEAEQIEMPPNELYLYESISPTFVPTYSSPDMLQDYSHIQPIAMPILPQLNTHFSNHSISTMDSFDLSFSPNTNSSGFPQTPRSLSFGDGEFAMNHSPVPPFPDNGYYITGSALTFANMCQRPMPYPPITQYHEASVDDWLGNAIQLQDYKHGDLF